MRGVMTISLMSIVSCWNVQCLYLMNSDSFNSHNTLFLVSAKYQIGAIKTYCQENMSLALYNCDPKKGRNNKKRGSWMAEFNLLDFETHLFGLNGVQLQINDTNLCVQRMGSRDVSLQQCNAFVEEQRWLGFGGAAEQRTVQQGTEIKPSPGVFMKRGIEYESCLSQHHHPRQGERIYVQPCRKARNSDTNLWSVY